LNIGLTDEEAVYFVLRNGHNILERIQLPMGLLFTNLRHDKLGTGLKWSEIEPNIHSSRGLIFGFHRASNYFPGKENRCHLNKKI